MRISYRSSLALLLAVLCLALLACGQGPSTLPSSSIPPAQTTPGNSLPTVTQTTSPSAAGQTVISSDFAATFNCHFGFMPAFLDYPDAKAAGAAYDRPFFELFTWGTIESRPGYFNFSQTDASVEDAQSYGFHILANIQPFAGWDQEQGYNDPNHKGKPYDMAAYANFVTKLVERYDGDNVDDMPGLTVPIKHWEVMNEPEFQTNPIYFQGSPADYAEVLKVTYEAVKNADPQAYVVQGGMAGMMDSSAAWWQGVLDAGGGQYMDIMNMHSIGHGEHLNIPAFKAFLARNGLQNKPIWVTEVQYQQAHETQSFTNQDFAKTLARSYIFALANGVDKLFYVNVRMPSQYNSGIPFDERSALITDAGAKSALFYAHLTVADMLGALGPNDSVVKIKETVNGWFVTEGQYKFTIGGKVVYALWGSSPPPAEISGNVRVIDISGAERTADAASLQLTDSPIFVLPD